MKMRKSKEQRTIKHELFFSTNQTETVIISQAHCSFKLVCIFCLQ